MSKKIICLGLAALGLGLQHPVLADPSQPASGWQIGPVTINAGGFVEAAGVYRSMDMDQDVLSSFNDLPFNNDPRHYQTEYTGSARQSRLDVLVRTWQDQINQFEAYAEVDLLGSDHQAYIPHDRVGYLVWTRRDAGFYLLAGQDWSLATPYKSGLKPRQENIPITIDARYVPGFTWTRQPQVRIVGDFGPLLSAGLSLEQPRNQVQGLPTTGPNAASSKSIAPDLVWKLASDPGFGHFELFGLTRAFRDRAPQFVGVTSSTRDNTTVATSIGADAILPLVKNHLDFQASGLLGSGNGRYGSGQLPDTVYDTTDGSLYALREQQALLGLLGHFGPIDAYAYTGIEHSRGAFSLVPTNNQGCNFNSAATPAPPSFACGNVGTIRDATTGFWWEFYKGAKGFLMAGPEFEYINNHTYTAVDGSGGHANEAVVMISLRYYPYQ